MANRLQFLTFITILALSLAGCMRVPLPASSPTLVLPPVTTPSLTIDQLRNMKVRLVAKDTHATVQLVNGEYKVGTDATATDFADVKLVDNPIAFGDLNGDGLRDAAVLLAENYGGTGVFVSLVAVLNRDGQPVQAGASMIDDRPKVQVIAIQDGQILLAADVHGPQDPGCCAAQPVSEVYRLTGSNLVLRQQASTTPDGTQRVIRIQSPNPGQSVAPAELHVGGTYTVPPFENSLTYRVFDNEGNTLGAGSLPANDGSFDGGVDLTSLAPGTAIRLEVADMSAANGTTLALDSVDLTVK